MRVRGLERRVVGPQSFDDAEVVDWDSFGPSQSAGRDGSAILERISDAGGLVQFLRPAGVSICERMTRFSARSC